MSSLTLYFFFRSTLNATRGSYQRLNEDPFPRNRLLSGQFVSLFLSFDQSSSSNRVIILGFPSWLHRERFLSYFFMSAVDFAVQLSFRFSEIYIYFRIADVHFFLSGWCHNLEIYFRASDLLRGLLCTASISPHSDSYLPSGQFTLIESQLVGLINPFFSPQMEGGRGKGEAVWPWGYN